MMQAMLRGQLLADPTAAYEPTRQALQLVAPLVGAGLFAAFGGAVVALVDAGTFLASAATLVMLRFREPPPAPKEQRFLHDLSAGLRHIARTPVLRQLSVGVGAALLAIGFDETLIFAVNSQSLHRSPSFIGVLMSFQGAGAVLGGLTAAPFLRRVGDLRLAGLGVLVFGVADGFLLVPHVGAIACAAAVAGVGLVWAVVAIATAYQRRSPGHLQGRVAAASNMLFSVPQTISIALGAALITVIDYRLEIVIMTAAVLAAAGYLLTRRGTAVEVEVEPALA
jgi:hypothetical protein